MGEVEGFLVGDLFSKELNQRKSDLVVLEGFNEVVVLLASLGEGLGDLSFVFSDSLD